MLKITFKPTKFNLRSFWIRLIPIVSFILIFNVSKAVAADSSSISVLAKIDNQIITSIDLKDRYHFLLTISQISIDSKQEKSLLLNQLLQKMIDEKLQLLEAEKLQMDLSQEQLNESVERIALSQGRNLKEFRSFFRKNSISYQNYLQQIKSQILWSQIVNKVISPTIKVSEIEVNELLELKKVKAQSLKFSLAEIYIPFNYQFDNKKMDARALATKLLRELKKGNKLFSKYGDDFANLAEQFSRSATAEFGGEIGWVGEEDIDKSIYEEISKIEIGEVTNPIAKGDGYYLFKLLDKKYINNLTPEDIEQVKDFIFKQKLQIASKSHLMDLRRKSFIEIDRNALKAFISSF